MLLDILFHTGDIVSMRVGGCRTVLEEAGDMMWTA